MAETAAHHIIPDLLAQIALGNEQAFRSIFDLYWDKIYSVSLAFTKSAALSEELTQDIFLKIWIGREALPEVRQFESYLFTVARNHIYNEIRKKVWEVPFVEDLQKHFRENTLADDLLIMKDADNLIRKGVELLPPQQKAVFSLARFGGLSQEEIARQLNISRLTVKVHMGKALQALREHVQRSSDGLLLLFALYSLLSV